MFVLMIHDIPLHYTQTKQDDFLYDQTEECITSWSCMKPQVPTYS